MPSFEQVPDMPQSFGYKVLWFAVRASEPVSVLSALEFGEASPPTGRLALRLFIRMKVRRETMPGSSYRQQSAVGF
jgi:hypothetical protein